MKFSVNNQELFKSLSTVSRAISSKTTMPILECIFIEAKNNMLYLKGSDGELSIISKIPANISMEGCAVIPIKTITELIRSYPDETVNFSVDEHNVMNINCSKFDSKSDVSILGRNPDEYPRLEAYNVKDFFKVDNAVLKSMIKDTVFACAFQESVSPVLTGVLIDYKEDNLQFVALDGYKLALRKEKISENNEKEIRCIVPGRTLTELLKILSIYDYDTLIHITDNKFVVNIGDTQVISNILEGNYINYSNLIPKDIKAIVKLETKEMLKSVERAALITDETKNSLIKMNFTDEKLVITSESEIGKVTEDVNISKNGEDIKIAFNSKFFVEILKIISDDRIVIEFKDKLSPTLVKPVDSDKYLYLVMPVRYVE